MRSMWRPVLKQVRVRQGMSVAALGAEVQSHLDAGRMVVLDRYDEKTPGGSGKTFDGQWPRALPTGTAYCLRVG